ncbi:MAG: glycoside hydrolase family 88 protein [Deinococcota bacterium]
MSNVSMSNTSISNADLEQAVNLSLEIIETNMNTLKEFPESCKGSMWTSVAQDRDSRHWVDGFWVGLLWLAFAHTQDSRFEDAARHWANKLSWLKDSVATHDLGFIFYLSHVLGARITGDDSLCANALHAAGTLIKRFNAKGEYLQAWGTPDGSRKDRGRINIDVMMNLELLYWASHASGDARYANIATQHAQTSRLTLLRSDGSIAQVGDFDPDTGLLVRQETHQGFSFDGCWSRGHAWGQYGFATAYLYTARESFLAASRATALYAQHNLPKDLVPFWDYDSPDIPNTYRDSSAAAVYACGLLELQRAEHHADQAAVWHELATQITHSLWRNYNTQDTNMPALLQQGSRSVPHGYMDHALIYGDYYFFEALTKLTRPDLAERAFPGASV